MGKINKKILVLALFLFGIYVFGVDSVSAQTNCLSYPSGATAPSGYGASWDVFDSAKRLLIQISCTPNSDGNLTVTIGTGDTNQLVYQNMYSYKSYDGAAPGWKLHPLKGTASNGDWLTGPALPDGSTSGLSIPAETSATSPYYIAAYVCTNRSGTWKCGCRDSACTTPHWQLQGYKAPASSGGGTGGGTGGNTGATAGFPAITPCGTTQNVSGGSLSSAASADGCRTIIAAAGSYGSMVLNGHTGGVVTVKCATPGACTMGNGSKIEKSDGVIIDGFRITGGNEGLRIDDSNNVLVRNMTFTEQTNSGLLVYPGSAQENIQIYDNSFRNDKVGCNMLITDRCSTEAGGYPVANMDYGVRIYDAKSIAVRGNTFSSLSNHWVSLKSGVTYALIEDNTFNNCGRVCLQMGQEVTGGDTIEAIVRNNTLTGKMNYGISIGTIRKISIINNTINNTTGVAIHESTTLRPSTQRTVIQSGNK